MIARVVDARFAGGPIIVEASRIVGTPVVNVTMPGTTAGMFADEARRLAVVLIEAAADKKRSR